MATKLKSFRLNTELIPLLEAMAKEMETSEAGVIEVALEKFFEENRQWEEDLATIAKDLDYQKQQIDLANEFYEDL